MITIFSITKKGTENKVEKALTKNAGIFCVEERYLSERTGKWLIISNKACKN